MELISNCRSIGPCAVCKKFTHLLWRNGTEEVHACVDHEKEV